MILSLIPIISGGGDKVYSHDLDAFNHYVFGDNIAVPAFGRDFSYFGCFFFSNHGFL